jgi:hypothetical protein
VSTAPIDTRRPVTFYDDRGKGSQDFYLTRVLFEDATVVLGEAKPLAFDRHGRQETEEDEEVALILFNKADGIVLVEAFAFWYAENPDNPAIPVATRPLPLVLS